MLEKIYYLIDDVLYDILVMRRNENIRDAYEKYQAIHQKIFKFYLDLKYPKVIQN